MAKLFINENQKLSHINAEIYGHFSEHLGRCIYEGLFVGENSNIPNINGMRKDVVEALKNIKIPVLRWPGGCFADEYHWQDGIGPKETRKKMINTHWGGVLEDNSFGTHEFMELCEQIGAKAYINGNLGSGSVREMSEWIEYLTFDGVSPMADLRRKNGREKPWKVDYFGVGNENWGCGGNMTPEYYANEYRRYQTYLRNYDAKNPIFKICCGSNGDDFEWTEKVLETAFRCPKDAHGFMDGLSLHYYVVPDTWENKGSAIDFDEKDWYKTLNKALYIESLIKRHSTIMDKYDVDKKVGMIVDEWGAWYNVEVGTNPGFLYQQNTMRDALLAGITLNIFNKHSDRVKMANIAQTVNVLQSVILTEGESMILTPTYHVFDLYKNHQNADLLESSIETTTIGLEDEYKVVDLQESVSIDESGFINITINNISINDKKDIEVIFTELKPSTAIGKILTNKMNAYNTFENPTNVTLQDLEVSLTDRGVTFNLPACSVAHIKIK